MKYLIKSIVGAAIATSIFAGPQSLAQSAELSTSPTSYEQKNLIKLNAGALLLKTFSVQYERMLTRKTSLSLGFRATLKSGLPFKSTIESIIDDDET